MAEQLNSKIVDLAAALEECEALEAELAALKAAYEQYFLGLERHPPTPAHRALKKRFTTLRGSFVRQTAAKFRIANFGNKLATYERLWDRTIKEMEAGTYRRDLFKAKLHAKRAKGEGGTAGKPSPEELGSPAAPSIQGVLPPVALPRIAPVSPATASAPPPPATLSDQKLRAVYDAYLTARRRCNEDISKLSFDALAATLRRQVPDLLRQHNAKAVEFKVVIKDGKAVLRAIPK